MSAERTTPEAAPPEAAPPEATPTNRPSDPRTSNELRFANGPVTSDSVGPQALAGLTVIDMATVLAGPGAARHLADFGADVVKVEAPSGDSLRRMGWRAPGDADSYLWKITGRNKRAIVLDLKSPTGLARMRELLRTADVLVDNSRPGALERLGLDPAGLLAVNPGLVILRVTGFGLDGPYSDRAGFATIAEALSGYASISGEPDGPPLLPPVALTDEVTALAGAFAIMVALRYRDATGQGQVVDVNLLESIIQMLGALPTATAHLGYVQPRMGSGIPYSVPRGTYRCADGTWVAVSASSDSVASRVLALLGLDGDPRFATFESRAEHRHTLDELVGAWIGRRPSADVLAAFQLAQAAIARVNTTADLLADPHVKERNVFVDVDGVTMPGPVARLSATPGAIRHAGAPLDAHRSAP
jgi:crotonobetainyl-CoA:carnitine CoA-transferase CaiB-like acyl-CoA transferase